MVKYTMFLEELNEESLVVAGGKGANLGVMIKAGLPVPPGYIISAQAYRKHLEDSGADKKIKKMLKEINLDESEDLNTASKTITEWILESPMPKEIEEEATRTYEGLTKKVQALQDKKEEVSVAVRSSATAEDLPTASFAGQQETYLGVMGIHDVLRSIKLCWASLWSPQALSYRHSMDFEHLRVDIAVVVQTMVNADASGVMFTANPVTGSSKEVMINSNYGLGETVVSGIVTPDSITLRKDGSIKEKVLGDKKEKIILIDGKAEKEITSIRERKKYSITNKEILQLLELAKRVEDYYGKPQDTEWAISRGKLYLLQARPITTLSEQQFVDLDLLWKRKKDPVMIQDVMEHSPEPLTPLDMAVFTIGDKTFQQAALGEAMGMKPPRTFTKPVERNNGMIGIQLEQAGFSPALAWKMPKSLISKAKKNPMDLWAPLFKEMEAYKSRISQEVNSIKKLQPMAELLQEAIDEFEPLMHKRFSVVFMTTLISELIVGFLAGKALGKKEAKEIKPKLFQALPFRTAIQNKELTKLAALGKSYGLESDEFQISFNEYLNEYGARPARGMILMPSISTLKEDPVVTMDLIKTLMKESDAGSIEERDEAQRREYLRIRAMVEKSLGKKTGPWFNIHLDKARDGEIVREESLFIIEKLIAGIREIALKLGDLFVEESIVNTNTDVFFLFLEEIHQVAEGGLETEKVRDRICKRKEAFDLVLGAHNKGQHWMITTGSIPSPKVKEKKRKNGSQYHESFQGISASQGITEGRVCIIKTPEEFDKIQKGDILVAPFTAPVWTPLFRIASGVVTEIGSSTCHAAIVSREYGIPSVVAVPGITGKLTDGQNIVVDGTNGIIGIKNK